MSEPIREQLAKALYVLDWRDDSHWDELRDDYLYGADAILAKFKVEVLSPVGETEAASPGLKCRVCHHGAEYHDREQGCIECRCPATSVTPYGEAH